VKFVLFLLDFLTFTSHGIRTGPASFV